MTLLAGPRLGLLIDGALGESHYSEFMRLLRGIDTLVQPAAISMTLATPPASPANGDTYIIPTGATGAWAAYAGKVARYTSAGAEGLAKWEYFTPAKGWVFNVNDDTGNGSSSGNLYRYSGTAWVFLSTGATGGAGGVDGWRGSFHNLSVITTGTDYSATITAESLCVADSSYAMTWLRNVSLTVNGANAGAGGLDTGTIAAANWYYLYVIYNPTTFVAAAILSLSSSGPTLPDGYTAYALVSACRAVTSTTYFRKFKQTDDYVDLNYDAALTVAGVAVYSAVTLATATAVSFLEAIPPINKSFRFKSVVSSASLTAYLAFDSTLYRPIFNNAVTLGLNGESPETNGVTSFYYKNSSASYNQTLYVTGYRIRL